MRILPALWQTLGVTTASMLLATALATGLEIVRGFGASIAHGLIAAFIDIVKERAHPGDPLPAVFRPTWFGIYLSAFAAGSIGLGLVYSVYIAEILRGGVQSVARGQREAALAVGLRPLQSFWLWCRRRPCGRGTADAPDADISPQGLIDLRAIRRQRTQAHLAGDHVGERPAAACVRVRRCDLFCRGVANVAVRSVA